MKTSLLLAAFFITSFLAPYYSFAGKNAVVCDTVGPTAVCVNGLSATLIGNFPLEIWAADLDAASFGCPPLTFQLNRITDINGDGQVDSGDYLTTPPNSDIITFPFLLEYYPRTFPIQFWVIDSIGRFDFCVTDIEVHCRYCNFEPVFVNIYLNRIKNEPIPDAIVTPGGVPTLPAFIATNQKGEARFTYLEYSSQPLFFFIEKEENLLEGINEKDFKIIEEHILGNKKITNPLQLIAADVNNSKSITVADLVELRKVKTGIKKEFSNNTSWRFLPRDFSFPNPLIPWKDFPIQLKLPTITGYYNNYYIIGVKIGDVI